MFQVAIFRADAAGEGGESAGRRRTRRPRRRRRASPAPPQRQAGARAGRVRRRPTPGAAGVCGSSLRAGTSSARAAFCADLGDALDAAQRAERLGVDPGELGAEEEDLRRVVDPDEDDDQRAGGAEARGDAALADVQADQELADREQQRGDDRAEPDVVPLHVHARHELVDHREDERRQAEADDEVDDLQQHLPAAERRPPPLAERRDRGAEDERDHQQEGEAEDHAEREQARAQQRPEAALLARRRAPDAVERVLQLAEHRGRAEHEQGDADDRCATMPLAGLLTLASRPCTALAASAPISPCSWRTARRAPRPRRTRGRRPR